MKLGNSNGNNRGKRYFIKGRDDVNPEKLYAEEANQFSTWFGANYKRLRRDVRGSSPVNDDVFNDTFLRIYELILYTGRKVRDYKAFFHRAYFTNLVQASTKENRYCNFNDYIDSDGGATQRMENVATGKQMLVDESYDVELELEERQQRLKDDIMGYVYQKYKQQDFEIFKMYMELKPAINYHALSKITGQKYHNIQRTVSTIVMDVKQHNEFHHRRRELL